MKRDVMETTIDELYDAYLNVNTREEQGDDAKQNKNDNIYEATSYFFLERLFRVFPFEEGDYLADFGCGKGRVLFMASKHACGRVAGYENNAARFGVLQKNVAQYQQRHGANTIFNIQNTDAQSAAIDDAANKFFFFEPFDVKIYAQVIRNIQKSLSKRPRDAAILLYLPDGDTMEYLDGADGFQREIHVDASLFYRDEAIIHMRHFAIYSNYPMLDMVDPYFLLY